MCKLIITAQNINMTSKELEKQWKEWNKKEDNNYTEETLSEYIKNYGNMNAIDIFLSELDTKKNYSVHNSSLNDYYYYIRVDEYNHDKKYIIIYDSFDLDSRTTSKTISDFINRNELKKI